MLFKLRRVGKLYSVLLLLFFLILPPNGAKGQDYDYAPEDEYPWEDEFFFFEDEGITVVASPQTSQQMEIIDKEQIQRHNAADLAGLLQETLNLGFTSYGSYGNMSRINLRGFDSTRVAFLIDGVPLNSAQNGEFDINQIGLNSIERIEVIYGGSDTKYNVSGALGGVINIITVKKQQKGLRFGASVSNTSVLPSDYHDRSEKIQSPHWGDLLDSQNYSFSALYGGNDFSVSANAFVNRAANHFIFSDSYNRTRRKDNNEVWDIGVTASVIWNFSDLSKLIFSPNFYHGDKNIPSSGFSSIVGKQKDTSTRQNLMLDMPITFREDLATEASLTYYLTGRNYTDPGDTESRHNQHSITAINRWNWYPVQLLTLRSGFDYRFIYLNSTDMGNRDRYDGGIYLTAEYIPRDSFLIIPSVKAVFTNGGSGGGTVVPKLGFLWNVNDTVSIKNNYFRSFKFPDFEDLYWTGGDAFGNPDLKPEDGWGGDIGVSWGLKNLVTLDSTFFIQWTKDSIHWYYGSSGVWRPENVGEAIYFGWDSKFNIEIPVAIGPIKKIIPGLSYQYLRSYLLSYGYTYASDKRIPYMPVHTIGGSLDIPWGTGSLLISAHYESLRYANVANNRTLDPHFLLNATANQKLGNNFTVFGTLRNILNTSYQSFSDYPMPGISLTLGVRVQYEVD